MASLRSHAAPRSPSGWSQHEYAPLDRTEWGIRRLTRATVGKLVGIGRTASTGRERCSGQKPFVLLPLRAPPVGTVTAIRLAPKRTQLAALQVYLRISCTAHVPDELDFSFIDVERNSRMSQSGLSILTSS